jgi:hypothetical protein
MRTIKMQPDEKLSRFIEDGLAAVVGMMPVLPNNGIIFDRENDRFTVVNRRQVYSWTVSFRGGPDGPDMRHYDNPSKVAQAILSKKHILLAPPQDSPPRRAGVPVSA